jgi:hypothetical protein
MKFQLLDQEGNNWDSVPNPVLAGSRGAEKNSSPYERISPVLMAIKGKMNERSSPLTSTELDYKQWIIIILHGI